MNSYSAARTSFRTFGRIARPNAARNFMSLASTKYTATAVAQGAGRNGTVSSNGKTLKLATPKELGGAGDGENPEQLFAMGYSACLLGAIQLVARQTGKTDMAKNAKVHVSVHLGEAKDLGGFGIGADVTVEGIDDELLQAGHAACPYSRALKHGVNVQARAV